MTKSNDTLKSTRTAGPEEPPPSLGGGDALVVLKGRLEHLMRNLQEALSEAERIADAVGQPLARNTSLKDQTPRSES